MKSTTNIFPWLAIVMFFGGCMLVEKTEPPKRVLFIGNSYTHGNNLPALFTNMVNSADGKVPLVKSYTPGGYTLIKHSKDPKALALIDEGNWDSGFIDNTVLPTMLTIWISPASSSFISTTTKSPAGFG